MVTLQIGFGRIFVAAIVGWLVGALWYMPPLFGKAWNKAHGFKKKELKELASWKTMGLGFVGTLITSLVLAILLSAWGEFSAGGAAIIALIVWIGFIATTHLNYVLWGREPESAYIINTLYHAVAFIVMAMILVG